MSLEDNRIVITDIDMPFGSMVRFMIRWALAAVPAAIILAGVYLVFAFVISALFNLVNRLS